MLLRTLLDVLGRPELDANLAAPPSFFFEGELRRRRQPRFRSSMFGPTHAERRTWLVLSDGTLTCYESEEDAVRCTAHIFFSPQVQAAEAIEEDEGERHRPLSGAAAPTDSAPKGTAIAPRRRRPLLT